jgi:signal transduction histidine kinase
MAFSFSRRELLLCLPILLVSCGLAGALHFLTQAESNHAMERYTANANSQTRTVVKGVEASLDQIYTNLRTLAQLPGVRKIDRHAINIDADTRTTFQQVYNNLATSVDISEVYIISEDFNPDRLDPFTGKHEEPILMFDELIIDGGAQRAAVLGQTAIVGQSSAALQDEVEDQEYKQFVDVIGWYKRNYPSLDKIQGLAYPVRSGAAVITCDNRYFNDTKNDADRTGMTFSVPFYRADGKLGGVVAAIVLNRAITNLLPSQDYAVVNTQYGFATGSVERQGQANTSTIWVAKAKTDPELIYSEVVPLKFPDPSLSWKLWAGEPRARFLNGAEMRGIQQNRNVGFPAIAFLTLAAMTAMLMYDRSRRLAQALEQEKLQVFSKLTAKFSHEIRNPLGSINNAVFIIRRVAGSDEKLLKQTTRAENAIKRCDKLIADMLAFGHPQQPILRKADFADWLAETVGAYDFPPDTTARLEFRDEPLVASFDGKQIARAVGSLLENAIQSVPAGQPAILNLECGISNGQIELLVTDNGSGISQEAIGKVFEPLFTTKNFGAGLGLPIAREIMKNHGGALKLENNEHGGVKASLTLPLAKSAEVVSLRRSA